MLLSSASGRAPSPYARMMPKSLVWLPALVAVAPPPPVWLLMRLCIQCSALRHFERHHAELQPAPTAVDRRCIVPAGTEVRAEVECVGGVEWSGAARTTGQ